MLDQSPQDFAAIDRAHDQPPDEPYGHDTGGCPDCGETEDIEYAADGIDLLCGKEWTP